MAWWVTLRKWREKSILPKNRKLLQTMLEIAWGAMPHAAGLPEAVKATKDEFKKIDFWDFFGENVEKK